MNQRNVSSDTIQSKSSAQFEGRFDDDGLDRSQWDGGGVVSYQDKTGSASSSVAVGTPITVPDPVHPPTATRQQLLYSDAPGGFRLRPWSIFRKNIFDRFSHPYARPETYQDWCDTRENASNLDTLFFHKALLFSLIGGLSLIGCFCSIFFKNEWLVALFSITMLGSLWMALICQGPIKFFMSISRKMEDVYCVDFAPRIALKITGDKDLERRWEGVLQHAEKTGVPILRTDIDQFLSGPNLRPPRVNTSNWRPQKTS